MRVQKESKSVWLIAFIEIFVIFALFSVWVADEVASTQMSDVSFLYNRCYQMIDCLKHGEWPFLYYNDLGGVGYGSPIFYGQLTLVLFMPFLGSISTFIKVYVLCCILLNFFAFRSFLKRLSDNATLIACFYIISIPFLNFCTGYMAAFALGLGFSWLFWGFCIDFFRDGRNLYLSILTYFLIWQSNLNITILATVVCFVLFVYYFDKRRLLDYCKLFFGVLATVLFDIVNILAHLDSLRTHPLDWSDVANSRMALSAAPFGGFLFRKLLVSDICLGFMQFDVLVLFAYYFVRGWKTQDKRFKVRSLTIIGVVCLGYLVGVWMIWPVLYETFHFAFQFPTRYIVIAYGFLLLVFAKTVQSGKAVYIVLCLCLVDLVLANPLGLIDKNTEDAPSYFPQIVYAEYVGEGFVFGDAVWDEYRSQVHSESGADYIWQNTYNGVVVDCSSNVSTDVLTLPKLYYNWYRAYGEADEEFPVSRGYSNYCQVDIGSYSGRLSLVYEVPVFVLVLFWLQVCCVARWLVCALRKDLCYARAKRK